VTNSDENKSLELKIVLQVRGNWEHVSEIKNFLSVEILNSAPLKFSLITSLHMKMA
jgi:hypothetical protein